MATCVVAEAKKGPKTSYTYSAVSKYWPDPLPTQKSWYPNENKGQHRDLHFIGIPPFPPPDSPFNGGINIVITDEEGSEVFNIVGEIEYTGKRIVRRNVNNPILRVANGKVNIEVVTVNGEPETGSIEGVYIGNTKRGHQEMYTHGTVFFEGAKIIAEGSITSVPIAGSRLYTKTMTGTVTFPN